MKFKKWVKALLLFIIVVAFTMLTTIDSANLLSEFIILFISMITIFINTILLYLFG